jgi:hypothetical protein
MRRLILLSLALALLLGLSAAAQVHGVPPSVTSLTPGFPLAAPAPSVTSLGPNGFHGSGPLGFGSRVTFGNFHPRGLRLGIFVGGHHRGRFGAFSSFAPALPVYIPYVVPTYPADYAEVSDEAAAETAPLRLDNRFRYGTGYLDRREAPPAATPQAAPAVAAPPEVPLPEQPTTILVFRDGHRVEVRNYAIMGDELINFSGAPRRIELADLDVNATVRENDDHGIEFRLPNSVTVRPQR